MQLPVDRPSVAHGNPSRKALGGERVYESGCAKFIIAAY